MSGSGAGVSKLRELLEAKKKAAAARKLQEAQNESSQTSKESSSQTNSSGMSEQGKIHSLVSAQKQVTQNVEKTEDLASSSGTGEDTKTSGIEIGNHSLAMQLAELESALKANDPHFAYRLRDIHQALKNDPDIVTVLSEEEIGLIVQGLCKHTDVSIVATSTKSKTGKKTQPITADML